MFDRWKCEWDRTWAHRVFRKHHTQLNSLYWAHLSAANHLLKVAKAYPETALAAEVFPIPADDKGRKNNRLGQWSQDYKEFINWVRLNVAVSLSGYLEVYLQSAATLALESDPGTLLGAPRAIDGATLLKTKDKYSYSDYATSVVKGTWHSRLHTYKGYFGGLPAVVESSISELEQLRELRNGVAHVFGRELGDYKSRINFELKPLQRLSNERLKKWLEVAANVALAIDDHLREAHIGAYEVINYYHSWNRRPYSGPLRKEAAFKKHLNSVVGSRLSTVYFRELISYYESL